MTDADLDHYESIARRAEGITPDSGTVVTASLLSDLRYAVLDLTGEVCRLQAALIAVIPPHQSPLSRCWCYRGREEGNHTDGCLAAREALK